MSETSATEQMAEDTGSHPHRRFRPAPSTVGLGLSVVLGIALLLWGADVLARWGAESWLASNIQDATGTVVEPQVEVQGAFFLPQVVAGTYDRVVVDLQDVTSGPLQIQSVHAELTGVHVAFHDVLVRDPDPMLIDSSVEEATVTYEALNRYLVATGRPLTITGADESGEIALTGTIDLFGTSISATAQATLAAQDGALAVQPTQLDTDTGLDRASRLLLGQRFTFVVPMDPLPFGQQVTTVKVGDDAVTVQARGMRIVVRP